MRNRLITVATITAGAMFLAGCGGESLSNPQATQEAVESLAAVDGSSEEPTGAEELTLDKYDQLEEGMSIEQVEEILGPGILDNSMEMDDFTTEGQTIEISTYRWQSEDLMKSIVATFEGNEMNFKSQMGLE